MDKPKVRFEPLYQKCTYHYPENGKPCVNCDNTGKYLDGYYMITTNSKGKEIGWFVDSIK